MKKREHQVRGAALIEVALLVGLLAVIVVPSVRPISKKVRYVTCKTVKGLDNQQWNDLLYWNAAGYGGCYRQALTTYYAGFSPFF